MSHAYVIPYEAFDTGDIRCKNFWLADEAESYLTSWSYLQKAFPQCIIPILDAMDRGDCYIDVYQISIGEFREITWD